MRHPGKVFLSAASGITGSACSSATYVLVQKTIPGSSGGRGIATGSQGQPTVKHWLSGISQQEQSKRLLLNKSRILLRLRLDNLIRKQKWLGTHIFICSLPCSREDSKWFTRICKIPHDSSN